MALSAATITYDLSDYGLADFDSRRTKVWATNNVNGPVIDTEGNTIHLGSANGTVNADGTGSITVPTPGTGSNPASWQTTIHVDYPDRNADRGRGSKSFGPFTITVSADLADLVQQAETPPEIIGGDAWLATIDADDSSQYRVQQDARLSATYDLTMKPQTLVQLGDSITARESGQGVLTSMASDYTVNWSMFNWMNTFLGAPFTKLNAAPGTEAGGNEYGGSGKTAADLVADGSALRAGESAATWVMLLVGINDLLGPNLASATVTSDRIRAVVDILTAHGKRVLLLSVMPVASTQTTTANRNKIAETNRRVAEWAQTYPNVVWADLHDAIIDPATGFGPAGNYIDGLHLGPAGGSRAGYELAQIVANKIPGLIPRRFNWSPTTYYNTGTGGFFSGSGSAGGSGSPTNTPGSTFPISTGHVGYVNTGVTTVASKVPRTDGQPGEWQQYATSAGTNGVSHARVNSAAGTDWVVGGNYYGVVEFEYDAAGWDGREISATLYALGGSANVRADAMYDLLQNHVVYAKGGRGILVTPPLTVPSGTTQLRLDGTLKGIGTVRWGRSQVVPLYGPKPAWSN